MIVRFNKFKAYYKINISKIKLINGVVTEKADFLNNV
jgi:hypothetical protein